MNLSHQDASREYPFEYILNAYFLIKNSKNGRKFCHHRLNQSFPSVNILYFLFDEYLKSWHFMSFFLVVFKDISTIPQSVSSFSRKHKKNRQNAFSGRRNVG